MPAPAPGLVRVYGRVNSGRVRAGRWADVPAAELDDLEQMAFATRVDDHGRPAPDDIPQRCCVDQ